MIPKIIHYCWFGGNPMPDDQIAYVEGWKKHLPDYELRLWNETNFDVNMVPFTQQVAKAKKWGFIVDYIRAYAVYHYGGIYLDTDVELLKSLDVFLDNRCFGGFETVILGKYNIAPGLIFGGEQGCVIAKDIMDFYAAYNFIKEDGSLNLTASPIILAQILVKYGLKQNNIYQKLDEFTAYPSEYFCPMEEGQIIKLTENTHSIHHYAASWYSPWGKFKSKIVNRMVRTKVGKFIHDIFIWVKYGYKAN